MPVVVAAVEAVEVVVIKAAVEECVDETVIVIVVVATEDNNYIVYPLHVAVVAVANDDLHVSVLFFVEDREDLTVEICGQGGTSSHYQCHQCHHSGYREQQNNALHTKHHLLNREGGELPRPVS